MTAEVPAAGELREDVDVEGIDTPFQGYFRIDRYRLRHRLFGGGWSKPMIREVFERGHAVAVILYDPARDVLVLIEQFRIGALAASRSPWFSGEASPWLLEIVAGIIDPGETPEEVASREAVEEAGCEILTLEPVSRFLVSPGVTSETIILYLGRIDAGGAGGIHGLVDEHEDIRVVVAPCTEVFAWLDEGRIVNATALVALYWFRVNRDAVRRRWLAGDQGADDAALTTP
jgi:ADP-ribose pyrophosphatase